VLRLNVVAEEVEVYFMGYLVLFTIAVLWFVIDRLIRSKLKTPKRSWYKHERTSFAVLFYSIILAFIVCVILFPDTNFFIVFPFLGLIVNLLFGIEKYIYKKEEKLYFLYFFDAIVWFILGMTAYIFFN
jgi:hypothetical protein